MSSSPFEIIMLLCFGASWPFSVYKTWKSKTSAGRSFVFLWLVFIGYISGCLHKIVYHFDPVIALYAFNALLVLTDLVLCYRFRAKPGSGAKI